MRNLRWWLCAALIVTFLMTVGVAPAFAGEIVTWGKYDTYELQSDAPTGNDFVAVAGGYYNGYALRSDGTIAAWGSDSYDQVTDAPTGDGYVDIAAGNYFAVALHEDGTLIAWGSDYSGLGTDVPTGSDFVAVAAGAYTAFALRDDGTIEAWGYNGYSLVSGAPTDSDFVAIEGGYYNGYALRDDGTIEAWGYNGYSLVSGAPTDDDFVALGGGSYYSGYAIHDDGSIEQWGRSGSYYGIPPTGEFTAVDALGYYDAVALGADGTLAAWGPSYDNYGILNDLPTGDDFRAVTMTYYVGIAIQNSAPTATPSGGGTYELGANVSLGGTVADEDGDALDWEWRVSGAASALGWGTISTPTSGASVSLPTMTVTSASLSLGLGSTTFALTVDDGLADPVVEEVTVTVVDTTAPTLSLSCSHASIWPPNHKMVTVEVETTGSDLSGALTFTAVATSNEADNGLGDGDKANDIQNLTVDADTGDVSVDLRAERSGAGTGRIYTISVTATDSSGNATTKLCVVVIPHDKGKK